MKKITELTEQLILTLTQEELELMVKCKMAEEGIKLLTKPEQPNYRIIPLKDDFAYSIGQFQFLVKDREVANKISEFLFSVKADLLKDSYNNSDYNNKFLKPYSESEYEFKGIGEVNKTDFYTRETLLKIQEDVKANSKLKKEYEEDLSIYNANLDSAEWIREEIFGKYAEVNKKYYDLERMRERYSEYLELANQDTEIALKFLRKAYSVDKETEDYVLGVEPKVEVAKEKTKVDKPAKMTVLDDDSDLNF